MTRRGRRDAIKAVGAGVGLGGIGAVAGCLGDDADGDAADGDGNGTTDDTGDDGLDGDAAPITLGLQVDRTGALSAYGFWHERTVRGYVDALNADGGIGGRTVDLVVEDTGSDQAQAGTTMRKLVQQQGADVVIGSQSSGVSIASTALAKRFEVPYFPLGEAPSITGADGNRWVLRNNHSTKQTAIAAVDWGVEELGTEWTTVYQDYSFGQQYNEAVKQRLERAGGEVLEEIAVPTGTSDLAPYLNKVPDDTEVLFNALIGGSSTAFLRQSVDLDVPGERLGAIASVEGVDLSGVPDAADGAKYVTALPREPDQVDHPANDHLREVAGVDDTDETLVGGHYWASYEAVSWIADAVEATDWSGDDGDGRALVEWFETGPSVERTEAYPQGAKFFRPEDHQAFMDLHIEEIADDRLEVVDTIAIDEPPFESPVDYTAQSF